MTDKPNVQQAAPEAPATTAIERFRAECAEATRALKAYEAPASAQINDSDAPAKAVYRLFDGAEEHPWRNGGNSNKQDEARRYARAAIEASAQPVAAAPAEPIAHVIDSDRRYNESIINVALAPGTAVHLAAPAAPVAQATTASASNIKTWRERLPKGAGLSYDYAHVCAMKAEIDELRAALAQQGASQGQAGADDAALLDWLNEQTVDIIYLDDFTKVDVRGNDVRAAIRAAIAATTAKGGAA